MSNPDFNIFGLKNIFFVLFITFCIQFTELKIDVVKLSELLLLLITPFIYLRKINKWSLYLLIVFILWFIITICFNPFREFFLLKKVSILKKPYLITLGRFLELIACLNLFTLVFNYFKKLNYRNSKRVIQLIFNFSMLFTLFNISIYFLFVFKIISHTDLLYWDHGPRLKGWFVEGGPYGLMLSFTFILSFFYKSRYHLINRFILFFIILFAAKSKAGILLIIFWFSLLYYKKAYKKIRELNVLILVIGGLVAGIVLINLGDKYIKSIINVRKEMVERPKDVNLVMGRIAGLYIFPKMILDNPFLGNGLGNYPILRNNPKYLDFIPPSPIGKTDAHGYGGLVQLLVDGGLLILILFFLIVYDIFKKIKANNRENLKFIYIFLFFFIFGVQIYFLYPWILLGIITGLVCQKKETKKSLSMQE